MPAPTGGRGGMGLMGRIYIVKTHVIPFKDHRNSSALMVFQGKDYSSLPPLFSAAIYFTHPNTSPESVNPKELLQALQRDTTLESRHIRLELFFLPSAPGTEQQKCIEHYRAEKLARGDYTRQIQALESSGGARRNEAEGLPGLVPTYINDRSCDFYHGVLYICRDEDWRQGSQMMDYVLFDPISQDQYAKLVEGLDEPETLAPTYTSQKLIQVGQDDDPKEGPDLVGMSISDIAYLKTENETKPAWHEAVSRGWSSW